MKAEPLVQNKTVEIIPAVLTTSWKGLEEDLTKLKGVTRRVQIDVVDGRFAKGKTWPYKDGDSFAKIVEAEHGLPLWEELDFEFDLMVEDPMSVCESYVRAGASRVIVHARAPSALAALRRLIEFNEDMGSYTVKAGVAIGCLENPDILEQFDEQFDFVQVMGIEKIGRQGEPLSQKAVYLLERLRHRYPILPLQVDGGVKLENAKTLVAAGANRLVCGSAIFGADDVGAAYAALYNEVNGVS